MRTPIVRVPPDGLDPRKRRRLLWMVTALVVSVAVVGGVLAYLLLQPGPPLDLLSVSTSPDPAVPGQPVTVTARVQGGTFLSPVSVTVQYVSFFTTGTGGGSSLFHGTGESYSAQIDPFPDGTAVWLMVTAFDGHAHELSGNLTVNVGTITSGGPSGLRINSVVLSPSRPTSLDTPSLTANVTSSAAVTNVYLSTKYFYWTAGSTSSGGSGGAMMLDSQGNYTTSPGMFYGVMPMPYGTTVGTIWLYRLGAQDSAGDAVLSPVYAFTVASPPL